MSHTPGPWIVLVTARKQYMVATEVMSGPVICDMCKRDENRAEDAQLMAAAPETLEVCEDLVALIGDDDYIFMPASEFNAKIDKIYMKAKAAIAKATSH